MILLVISAGHAVTLWQQLLLDSLSDNSFYSSVFHVFKKLFWFFFKIRDRATRKSNLWYLSVHDCEMFWNLNQGHARCRIWKAQVWPCAISLVSLSANLRWDREKACRQSYEFLEIDKSTGGVCDLVHPKRPVRLSSIDFTALIQSSPVYFSARYSTLHKHWWSRSIKRRQSSQNFTEHIYDCSKLNSARLRCVHICT